MPAENRKKRSRNDGARMLDLIGRVVEIVPAGRRDEAVREVLDGLAHVYAHVGVAFPAWLSELLTDRAPARTL